MIPWNWTHLHPTHFSLAVQFETGNVFWEHLWVMIVFTTQQELSTVMYESVCYFVKLLLSTKTWLIWLGPIWWALLWAQTLRYSKYIQVLPFSIIVEITITWSTTNNLFLLVNLIWLINLIQWKSRVQEIEIIIKCKQLPLALTGLNHGTVACIDKFSMDELTINLKWE